MAKTTNVKTVTTLKHEEALRKNKPTAEYQSVISAAELLRVAGEDQPVAVAR
jgi:hypothetical protein